jgi:acyl-CoA synthetase (AMP-forming)/AMP-acid ligase II
VAALVSIRAGHDEPTLGELQEHCRQSIAGYKVPRTLLVLDHIERTPVGKPDYRWAKQVATNT